MDKHESLNHSKWDCKYHVVFIPRCRRETLYVQLRQYLGEVLRKLAEQKESQIEEGHLMPDHVHMMISIRSMYAVSQVIGFIKEKSHTLGAGAWRKLAKFRWLELLGKRVFRVDSWTGLRGDRDLYSQRETGRPTLGSDEPLALKATSVVA